MAALREMFPYEVSLVVARHGVIRVDSLRLRSVWIMLVDFLFLLFLLYYMARSTSAKSLVTAGQRQAESSSTKCVVKNCLFRTGLL